MLFEWIQKCEVKKFVDAFEWIQKCEVKENEESKCLLLWDKVLELCVTLAFQDNLQVVKRALTVFCQVISICGEDKSSDGFLGAVGFGRASNLSVNFRFLCRSMVAFILAQIPSNASLRLEAMAAGYIPTIDFKKPATETTEPSPSILALKAVENLRALLRNKPYAALRDLVNRAIEFVVDPKHSLVESRQFLQEFALLVFPKHSYLYAIAN
ncbi:hypothetical protein JTE90_029616 [Oedothorax gibbosus]|uniref:Uncharacterized protein n=1 Tax=Oedothorax gibbosus TaxID=931172 RepID=A0AAV6VGH1_9ARAC|nr:hypothetical protein JTE90_029616 [Oedothorax gibbosus]